MKANKERRKERKQALVKNKKNIATTIQQTAHGKQTPKMLTSSFGQATKIFTRV